MKNVEESTRGRKCEKDLKCFDWFVKNTLRDGIKTKTRRMILDFKLAEEWFTEIKERNVVRITSIEGGLITKGTFRALNSS